jgi:TonB family protein
VSQPVVRASSSWRLTYRALESLRSWRFEPARLAGTPVAALHEVRFNPPADSPPLEQLVTPGGELVEVAESLRAGRWAKAGKRGDQLWETGLRSALQSRAFYALTLTLRALAEAGEGKKPQAICRWQAAQAIEPRFFHADLSAYGAPGEMLEQYRWGLPQEASSPVQRAGEEVQAPSIVQRTKPMYPEFRKPEKTQGMVVVEAIIDRDGTIRDPRIDETGPGLEFAAAALDAVCDWRFAPARLGGEPVSVYYALTVNYEVR